MLPETWYVCISALVHTPYCAGKDSQPLSCSKKRRCSLLKAKIIQLVMKVCSVVNDWIRKSTVSPNQALLIAQRKDNQTQTNAPPPATSGSVHPEALRHIQARADWQRKKKPHQRSLSKYCQIIIWVGSRVAWEISQRSGVKCSSLERHEVTPRCTRPLIPFYALFPPLHSKLDTLCTHIGEFMCSDTCK